MNTQQTNSQKTGSQQNVAGKGATQIEGTTPADIRNVCVVGATASGKTTLVERLLFEAGAIKKLGSVGEGTTVSDFTEEEKHHQHSLQPSVVHLGFDGHLVNLIDTPGLSDFIGHAIACYPAVEMVACVVDATKPVATCIDSVSRRLLAVAAERRIPRMIVVNKCDEARDLAGTLAHIREELGNEALPITLPTGNGKGVVNVFEQASAKEASDFLTVGEAHKAIVEQVIEVDDELTMEYLEHGEGGFDANKLHDAFEKCLEQAHLVPVCFVSAKTGMGVSALLHVLASLCPSPVEVDPPEFVLREVEDGGAISHEKEWHGKPEASAKLLAHVFRVVTDPFLGKVAMLRVHQGTLRAKSDVMIDDHKKPVRLGHMFVMQGKEHIEVREVGPGMIAAVAKVDELVFGSVLHDSHELDSVRLRPLPMPRPVFGLALTLKNQAEETKFSTLMHKLLAEDPCLQLERNATTKQTVLRGLGELHLRIVLERIRAQHIDVTTAAPKVAYKETVTVRAEGHYRHKKQTGGSGQFGEVSLKVEPLPPDHPEGFEFHNDTVGGSIPKQYLPAVEKGVRQVLESGAIAGYPVTGIAVRVYDGKYHAVDSKEIAFVTAGKWALIEAIAKAKPALLEPYVSLEVTAPSKHMGDLAGHLSTKRGRVVASESFAGDLCVVRALAPMSEVQNYANELKSMTGGAGSFRMEYSHDERTPGAVQQAIVAAYKPREEEE
jgi:elongation factor G